MGGPFSSVHVRVDSHGYRHIIWTLLNKYKYPESCILRLEYNRAGGSADPNAEGLWASMSGKWLVLASNVSDLCLYIDYQHRNYNKYVNDYYRLVLLMPDTGLIYTSAPAHAGKFLSSTDSALANNLLRLALLLILQTGRKGVLLKRKLWGERCPLCTDFDNLNSVNLHCPVCLGTGISGGYYKGIPMSILLTGSQQVQAIGTAGYLQALVLSAKCVAWPWIHLADVWVDAYTNQRYYISKASVISKYKHVPLVYQLLLHLLLLTDVMHSLAANNIVSLPGTTLFVLKNTDWYRELF